MYNSETVYQILNCIQDPNIGMSYAEREDLKRKGGLLLEQSDVMGAMYFLLAWYARSREASPPRRHPSFVDYVAMLMNQEDRFAAFPEIRQKIISLYGRKPGIPYGTLAYSPMANPEFRKKLIENMQPTNKKERK